MDVHLRMRSLWDDLQLLGDLLWKVLQPQEGIATMLGTNASNIEHSRRLRGTGLRPEDSPGGHFVSYVLGTVRRKLSAGVPNVVRVSGQWNGKVSELYTHLRIWGSQVMGVTVDRTQATVPVRHC